MNNNSEVKYMGVIECDCFPYLGFMPLCYPSTKHPGVWVGRGNHCYKPFMILDHRIGCGIANQVELIVNECKRDKKELEKKAAAKINELLKT